MRPEASAIHPHEPEIPPAWDDEGRCFVCGLLVKLDEAEAELAERTRERDEAREALEAAREAIASAMTSLATGPMKDGYAYSVLDEFARESVPTPEGEGTDG